MAEPSVLVVCAMEEEAVHLRRRLVDPVEETMPSAAWRLTRGAVGGVGVRLLICNIGEANAAAGTAAMLSSSGWRPRAVINYGCSGAHAAHIREGDVVRPLRDPASPLMTDPCADPCYSYSRP